jgi:hypothetical protein
MDCTTSLINPLSRDFHPLQTANSPSVITYKKGEAKTRTLVPTIKEQNGGLLGKGCIGKVYIHRNNHQLVVKKSKEDLTHEFELGYQLSHRCIAKTEKLFIKLYEGGLKKFKLVRERIEGTRLNSIIKNKAPKLSPEITLQLLLDAKDTVGYLFDNKAVWADLQPKNIFVTQEKHLKFYDLGTWWWEENSTNRAQKLLLGAIELVFWINLSTSVESVMFDSNGKQEKEIPKKLSDANDAEKRRALELYFDCVIERFHYH